MIPQKVDPEEQANLVEIDFTRKIKTTKTSWPRVVKPSLSRWRSSEPLFSQVFSNSVQPMSITTLSDGRYLDVNASFLAFLGYTRKEVVGQTSLKLGIWKKVKQRAELVESSRKAAELKALRQRL